jgi:UDP-3-O-[3-hydroxymyristoyl] glucosamine N-acyltransferase
MQVSPHGLPFEQCLQQYCVGADVGKIGMGVNVGNGAIVNVGVAVNVNVNVNDGVSVNVRLGEGVSVGYEVEVGKVVSVDVHVIVFSGVGESGFVAKTSNISVDVGD